MGVGHSELTQCHAVPVKQTVKNKQHANIKKFKMINLSVNCIKLNLKDLKFVSAIISGTQQLAPRILGCLEGKIL